MARNAKHIESVWHEQPNIIKPMDENELNAAQKLFHVSFEERDQVLRILAEGGQEAVGSMGDDTPLPVLSRQIRSLYDYFRQQFAQVTNPAIDAIREETVMSIRSAIGGSFNIRDETPGLCRMLEIQHPILTNSELEQLRHCEIAAFRSSTIDMGYTLNEKTLKEPRDDF